MRKNNITLVDVTEDGFQMSKATRKEKQPITDKRLEIILRSITRNIIIVMSFWLAGKVLPDADIFKTVFSLLFASVIITIYLIYLYQSKQPN